jgi:hypothetical protein
MIFDCDFPVVVDLAAGHDRNSEKLRAACFPGGPGLLPPLELRGQPNRRLRQSPHWRNFMSRELFAHLAHKEGLSVLRAKVVDWGADAPSIDCLAVLERPPA